MSKSGSVSGSATPSTSYGSFPPGSGTGKGTVSGPELEERLRGAVLRADKKGKGLKRSWGPSSARVLVHHSSGLGRQPSITGDDVFDSDADLEDDDYDEESGTSHDAESSGLLWARGRGVRRTASGISSDEGRERRARSGGFVEGNEQDKQPGVLKMEMMGRSWGRKGLVTIYAGVYLISALMSLESNTTPIIEPYFLSQFKAHSLLGSLAIITNIAYAVGKPPMTKILDVFGRAEGVAFAAFLYFFGYLLTAASMDVRVFVVARAIAALGGQGLQLSQQIIIADTTTLTNRGLITSTISLPWLFTTWLGPPLGSFFQRQGEAGYRLAYALFGTLLPLISTVLISRTYFLMTGGVTSLAFFAYYEFRWSPLPLLPPRLLKNRTILCGSFLGFFHFLSQFVYESFFTSFLQVARGHSTTDAAYISQSYIFSASIAAILAGAGAKYTQRYRWIGITGVVVHGMGTWLMMRTRNLDSATWELVLSQMLGGVGGGFTTIAAQIGCQSVVGHQDVGIATTTFLTITQIGGAVGGAAAGAIWSTLLPSRLAAHLPTDSLSLIPEIMASLPYTLTFEMGTPIRTAINAAYVETQQRLNLVAIVALLPALLCVCAMKNTDLEREDQGQGEGVVVLGRASFLAHEEDNGNSETSSLLGAD
ncbi:hypothetical protein RQP46_001421 [Phenoliferia psychrophenolica]